MAANNVKSADYKIRLRIFGLVLIPLVVFIFYRIADSQSRLIPLSVIALIAGAIIENRRISEDWKTVFNITWVSFLISFLSFLPGKHEQTYLFDNHVKLWPYIFLLAFVMISIVLAKDKIVAKLSEAITLVMSVAIIYWISDHAYFHTNSVLLKLILGIAVLIACFSILNAFLDVKLTGSMRLFLSLWSSLIMALLAADNIYSVYSNGQIEDSMFLADKINFGLQYFFLGVSAIYIVQNILMIIGFLPGKNHFFNKSYFRELEILKKEHLARYSEKQSEARLSFLWLAIAASFFILNFYKGFVPRNTAIWIVFFIIDRAIYFWEYLTVNKTRNRS